MIGGVDHQINFWAIFLFVSKQDHHCGTHPTNCDTLNLKKIKKIIRPIFLAFTLVASLYALKRPLTLLDR